MSISTQKINCIYICLEGQEDTIQNYSNITVPEAVLKFIGKRTYLPVMNIYFGDAPFPIYKAVLNHRLHTQELRIWQVASLVYEISDKIES